jgi:ABC-type antimicrobial peptide transport system permease subunit
MVMFMENKKAKNILTYFISIIIVIIFSIILFIFAYNILIYFIPPQTPDGHPVMPFKQIFLSGSISIVLTIIFSIFIYKRFLKKTNE